MIGSDLGTNTMTVVMVDANAADQRLLQEAFTTVAACAFVPLRSTDEALEYIDKGRPADLIVLTLDSDSEGLDFLRVLRADEERQHIRVAVFGSGTGPNEAKVVESSGAHCYMEKPLNFTGHLELASELVSKCRLD